jgi:signal transduction histidine kinase/CheY-like chemotaxis protein
MPDENSDRMKIHTGLFARYALLFVVVVSFVLLANSASDFWLSFQDHEQAVGRAQHEQAQAAASKIEQFIANIVEQLGWTTQLAITPTTTQQNRFDAERLLRQVPAVMAVQRVDDSGHEQLRISRIALDVIGSNMDMSHDPSVTGAKKNGVYYGPVYFRRQSEPYMIIALAGQSPNSGITVAEVNLKLIYDVISSIKVGETGLAYVVDGAGRLIAHPDLNAVLRNTDLSQLAQVKAARSGINSLSPVEVATNLRGQEVLTSYASVPHLNWLVFVEMPTSEANAPLMALISRSALIFFAALIFAIFAGLFLARKVVVPIRILGIGAQRMAAGDLDQRIEVKGGRELELLAEQFNNMAERLRESHSDLENKIELRTVELHRSVDELRALSEVSRAVNSTLELKTVLSTIVAKAVQLSGADAGSIYIFDPALQRFQLHATYGMDESFIAGLSAQHARIDDAQLGPAISKGEPMQIPDLRDCAATPINQIVLEAGFRSLLIAPLLRPGQVFGVLVTRRKEPGLFLPATVQLINTFAIQSALAIHNARMFTDLEERSRQLEFASQHKSQFLANMSHELRTPLNAIIGLTEMLISNTDRFGTDKAAEPLRRVHRAGEHLLELINEVLDLSKIEAGKLELTYERIIVPPLLEAVVGTARPLAEKNSNRLIVQYQDKPPTILTDAMRLRQVLLNLLSNACKFTKDGDITLRVARTIHKGTDALEFSVIDTGIGMTAEQIARVFEVFTQGNSTTAREYGGTGLGLTITRRLCRMLGGDVTVTSELGKGSTFVVQLPIMSEAPSEPVTEATIPVTISPRSHDDCILVIDDDATARDLIVDYLSGAGFSAITASSGREGIKLAKEEHPLVITLDVVMPDLDGWSVLAALRNEPDLVDTPVVMTTIVDDQHKGMALGAAGYLTKPIERRQFIEMMQRLRGLRRPTHVLVVEDDATQRECIRNWLQPQQWIVIEAANGRVAIERLAQKIPDVILLDLMMPEMDGFQLVAALQENPAWQKVPVIVITALDLSADDRQRLNQGVQTILVKSAFDPAEIVERVRQVIAKSQLPDKISAAS